MHLALKYILLLACSTALISAIAWKQQPSKTMPPNIVYILADDLGYGDLSVYNPSGHIKTPNLDKLAAQGMRFTDAHSPSGVCTPTRYGILTGRYPWRSRLPVGVLRGYSRTLIEPNRPTVASLLKNHGYSTAVVGKWHLGLDWVPQAAHRDSLREANYGIDNEMLPAQIDFSQKAAQGPGTVGFDYSYVLPASLDMPPYCYLENHQLTDDLNAYSKGNKPDPNSYAGAFWREGKMSPSFDFFGVLPRFIEKATDFIKKQSRQKPFFLYLPLAGPHTPWMPTEEYRGKSPAGEYGDFVQQVDAAVGQVLATLEQQGLAENTIVIFTSDNGPYWHKEYVERFQHLAAGPFRGMKGDAFEGGHRIPFIVRWPGKVKAGSISQATTCQTHLLATCAELLKEKDPRFQVEDSYSILPVLLGKKQHVPGQPAVVHSSSIGFFAIRQGDWKLIEGLGSGGFTQPKEVKAKPGEPTGQLYNMATDAAESKNLYAQYPEKVEELRALLSKIRGR